LKKALEDFEILISLIKKAIYLDKACEFEYIINPKFSNTLKELDSDKSKTYAKIEIYRKSFEDELGCTVKIIDSNTYTILFEVKKKEDEAFQNTKKTYKTFSIIKSIINFTKDQLIELIDDYSFILD